MRRAATVGASSIPLHRFVSGRPPVVLMGDLSLIRPLAMAKIPVILATPDPDDLSLASRHVAGHCMLAGFDDAGAARSLDALVSVGASLLSALSRKSPLFCGSDRQLDFVYRHRDALAESFVFLLNEEPIAHALYDKEAFYQLVEAASIRAPRAARPGEDVDAALDRLREPLVVKPKQKTDWAPLRRDLFRGTAKARVFATRAELRAEPAFQRWKDALLVQEHVGGGVDQLYSFHGFADENGDLLASFGGRKIRTFPEFGGESSFIELVRDDALDRVGRDIVARLKLRGPLKIDLIRDTSGELWLLEVNARYNLWHHLGAIHGVNLPAIAYEYLTNGTRPAPHDYEPSVRWLNFYRDAQAFRELHEKGALSLRAWLSSLTSHPTIYEIFAWDDPKPFAGAIAKMISQRFGR